MRICYVMKLFSLFANIKVNKQPEQPMQTLSTDDVEVIKKLVNRGMNVEAIKMVRKTTGLGLVEAKAFVDEIQKLT